MRSMLLILMLGVVCGVGIHAQTDHTPKINTMRLIVEPILSRTDPDFTISGIVVTIPELLNVDTTVKCVVTAEVIASAIMDRESKETYGLVVVTPVKVKQALNSYDYTLNVSVTMKLTGKMPLRPGRVKGSGQVMVNVVYTDATGEKHEAHKAIPFYTSD